MAKIKKSPKPKARLPRGFFDRSASDIRAIDAMTATIKQVYESYGFNPVETPLFEYTDALGKFLPDTDRPNAGVFSLLDDDDQWISLRYDLTAPLARYVAEMGQNLVTPYRSYRAGYVFRNEKPGPGRFRQFMQFDADIAGAPNVTADAEICMMLADTMEALGIKRGDYVVRVNNRKILDGLLEVIGLGGDENAEKRLGVLRSIDKLDRLGIDGVEQLLGSKGRTDESGDHMAGIGLDEKQIGHILSVVKGETVSLLHENEQFSIGYQELETIRSLAEGCGYGSDQIQIDPSCVRGLEYYTGPVFEVEVTFEVTNEKGQKVQFGSVAGGGRYDGLVSRFTGQPMPATGASIGVSRLVTALKNLGKLSTDDIDPPIVICVMDRDPDALAGYMQLTKMFRDASIRAEIYQGNPNKFAKQLAYADKIGAPVAIIQGSDERARGMVQVKDLFEGKRLAENINSNEEWRAARVAQQEVAISDMVETVKSILASEKLAAS